jgi:hypothetical protein
MAIDAKGIEVDGGSRTGWAIGEAGESITGVAGMISTEIGRRMRVSFGICAIGASSTEPSMAMGGPLTEWPMGVVDGAETKFGDEKLLDNCRGPLGGKDGGVADSIKPV